MPNMEHCECKTRKPHHEMLMVEYCVSCGRIWYLSFVGEPPRSTSMFELITRPVDGIWVGGVHVTGPSSLVSALKRCHT